MNMKHIAVLVLLSGFILGGRSEHFEDLQANAAVKVSGDGSFIVDADPLDQEISRLEKQFDLAPARDPEALEKDGSRLRIWIAVFSRIQPGCLDFVLTGKKSIVASYFDYVDGKVLHKEISLDNDANAKVKRLYNDVMNGRFDPDRKRLSDPDEALMVVETATRGNHQRMSFLTGTQRKDGKSVIRLVKELVAN